MFSKSKKKSQANKTQFSRRPSLDDQSTLVVPDRGWDQGYCYWVKQFKLRFGRNRKTPVYKRPVVAFPRRQDDLWIIFPVTTQSSSKLFQLRAEYCVCSGTCKLKESYLFYKYETVSQASLKQNIGSLHHSAALKIVQWYRDHYLISL
ncbi:MAG: hypothetical protein ABFS56_08740 [Pseudomonadota bacterium]